MSESKKNKPHTEVSFSINSYDYEGDSYEDGVYLHFGDTRVKVSEDIKGFQSFIRTLTRLKGEIIETYGNGDY